MDDTDVSRDDHIETYDDQTPVKAMERLYPIYQGSWDGNFPTNTNLFTSDLISRLFLIPNIKEKASHFRYFMADVEVHVRINSTLFHYGLLMGAWVPKLGTPPSNIFDGAMLPHKIINASMPETVVFKIPFIYPDRAVELDKGVPIFDSLAHPIFRLMVMDPLKNVNMTSSPSVAYSIFARFTNVKLSGIVEEAQHESGLVKMKVKRGSTNEDPEAEAKSKGTLTTVAEGVGTIADSLKNIPVIGGIATVVSPIAKAFGGLFDWLGWQNPLIEDHIGHLRLRHGSFSHSRGLDNSVRLSMSQNSQISGDLSLFKSIDHNENSIRAIAMTPAIVYVREITNSMIAGQGIIKIPVTPSYEYYETPNEGRTNYCSILSRSSLYWRGSMKYKVICSLPKSVSMRLRFSWYPAIADVVDSTDYGDVISRVVDFNGYTEVEFTVPYLFNSPYCSTERNSPPSIIKGIGELTVTIVNPIVSTTDEELVRANLFVYSAAGEDLEFYAPIGNSAYQSMSTPNRGYDIIQAECRDDFKKTFDPLVDAHHIVQDDVNFGECWEHIHDVLLRYYKLGTHGSAADYEFFNPFRHYLTRLFFFYRGGIRIKVVSEGTLPTEARLRNETLSFTDILSPKTNPVAELELPMLTNKLFLDRDDVWENTYLVSVDGPHTIYGSWTDDSTLSFLRPPTTRTYPSP